MRATDANGHVAGRHGVFDTDARHARVVFQRIHVIWGGDKGANRGELRFDVRAGNEIRERHEDRIGSNHWVNAPGGAIQSDDAPQMLALAAQGHERDSTIGCIPFDAVAWAQAAFGSRRSRCGRFSPWTRWTWSTAWLVLDLDAPPLGNGELPPGFGGSGMHNFVISQNWPPARRASTFTASWTSGTSEQVPFRRH